jgi:hypothetical protein
MTHSASVKGDLFERYIAEIRSIWGNGNDPQLPFKVKSLMEKLLASTSPDDPWMAQLIREGKPAKELYRDPDYGFVQKAHVNAMGDSNSPHDHGPCWVLYGCYRGAKEIMTYQRIDDGKEAGRAILEKKELHRLSPGVVYPYLPGDIHSDKTVDAPTVIFRFLSYDLEKVKRYRYNLQKGTVIVA